MKEKDIKILAESYKTPLYLFDGDQIVNKYNYIKNLLPSNFEIFYSVKANPNIGICKILQKSGSGIEVASEGELYLAVKAGFQAQDILFTGPGKTYDELVYAVENNISAINVESLDELKILEQIGNDKSKKIRTGIRIHPNLKCNTKNPALSMMGKGTQFGVDIDQLPDLFSYISKSRYLELVCLHVYAGSQIFDPVTSVEYFEQLVVTFQQLVVEHQLNISTLDFGGGFGVSYDGKKEAYDFIFFATEIRRIADKYKDFLQGKRIIFESGRYLLAEAGVFLTEVQYRKKLGDSTFLITDAGMNHYALATFREKKIRGNFEMKILTSKSELETVTVAGPLCTPDDILGRNVTLNTAKRGDVLSISYAGAYGSAYSPLGFLGHPTPCEILIYHDKVHVLKKHGNKEDILNGQEYINL